MDLSLAEALDHVRKWELQATEINGMLIADSSPLVVKFRARVAVHDKGVIMLTAENGFELSLVLREPMTFTYNDALLGTRMAGWRCCLYEPKSNHSLRLVK